MSVALITGGAGFIGTNLAHRLLTNGREVVILDNLSRAGAERNAAWLAEQHGDRLRLEIGDILDVRAVGRAVQQADEVYHLAAQVAVTTSLSSPLSDFETNARGTLNVLEAARAQPEPPALLFTSTNKVYGALDDIQLHRKRHRYVPAHEADIAFGISERRPLDFHSPYGCSKGAADQYVLDYARCFGLRAVVFRMSCIYGPHQYGNEDQGWVAHFLIRALEGNPLVLFGDGLQVRDVLYVDDLVDAMQLAMSNSAALAGEAFNIGGGPSNTLSLLELLQLMNDRHALQPPMSHAKPRQGDQRYYVSDVRKFCNATGWRPRTSPAEGVAQLHDWLKGGAREPQRRALALAAGQ
ncbi:MAG TPA: NAD-dependent epimerase/dehydratase family protein [Steroidobacteraceae bacterium]